MRKFTVNVNGVAYSVEVQEDGVAVAAPAAASTPAVAPVATPAAVAAATPAPAAVSAPKAAAPVEVAAGDTPVTAPMPGKVTKIVAKAGTKVNKGDVIMLLEAMKMQNEIGSPVAGTVKSINVDAGQSVKPGEVMAVIG